MAVSEVSHGPFRITASVPEDMVSLPTDGDWAAWLGASAAQVGGRHALMLVSITVTAFAWPSGGAANSGGAVNEMLGARLRARYPEPGTLVEEFITQAGHPAVRMRRMATEDVDNRQVPAGEAQALIAYPEPGALAVVSGACFHPDDIDAAAALVTEIATRLTVTTTAAAALPPQQAARERGAGQGRRHE